jgi:hypothetical protein
MLCAISVKQLKSLYFMVLVVVKIVAFVPEPPCKGTNSALAKSKVHQILWARGSPFMGGNFN